MLRKFFIGLIDIYRYFISPLSPPSCRFHPSCSSYTRQAIIKYGVIKGGIIGIRRILRCHPFHPGGYDPI